MKTTEPMRTESDSCGFQEVPVSRYWGASTQRCLTQFYVDGKVMPLPVIHAFGWIKKAAALAHQELGLLDPQLAKVIIEAAAEVAEGTWDDHFPLGIWQTGSGTATHMNVNEVIANRANEKCGQPLGQKAPVHPNDHVNMGQSTNDTFGTAMHVALWGGVHDILLPALASLIHALKDQQSKGASVVKVGRTHLQDAAPLTLGDEWGAFVDTFEASQKRIMICVQDLTCLPQGGTAVGTGLNAHPQFASLFATHLSRLLNTSFTVHPAPFSLMSMHDAIVFLGQALSLLAGDLFKMGQDLRLLSSGPRAGLGELVLPQNEPGSSIMPGKVNPTHIESLLMICVHVQGLSSIVAQAGTSGQLQLNVMKPLIVSHMFDMITLLANGMNNLRQYCLEGITFQQDQIDRHVHNSLMLVTALTPHIGYDKAARMARYAFDHHCSLKEANRQLGYVSEKDFDRWIQVEAMAKPKAGA